MIDVENSHSGSEKKSLATRLAVFLWLTATLVAMPTLALVATLDRRSGLRSPSVLSLPPVLWLLWGVCSLWITFDPLRFLRTFKESIDPLGLNAVALSIAGATNLVALVTFLILVRF
jgi:hypothetical protein